MKERFRLAFQMELKPGEEIVVLAVVDDASNIRLHELGVGVEFFYKTYFLALTPTRLLLRRTSSWTGRVVKEEPVDAQTIHGIVVEEVCDENDGWTVVKLRYRTTQRFNFTAAYREEAVEIVRLLGGPASWDRCWSAGDGKYNL